MKMNINPKRYCEIHNADANKGMRLNMRIKMKKTKNNSFSNWKDPQNSSLSYEGKGQWRSVHRGELGAAPEMLSEGQTLRQGGGRRGVASCQGEDR